MVEKHGMRSGLKLKSDLTTKLMTFLHHMYHIHTYPYLHTTFILILTYTLGLHLIIQFLDICTKFGIPVSVA
jgi:hypothetical protein